MYRYILALALLMLWGCQQKPEGSNPDDGHNHAPKGETHQFTLFSDNTELFIEHSTLEAGVEAEFLIHATRLDTYKPYNSGIITIEIDGVSVGAKPEHAGFYHIPFVPKKAGAFHLLINLETKGIEENLEGHIHVEDHQHDPEGGHTHSAAAHSHAPPPLGEITFLKEQAWKNDFFVEQIQAGDFSAVIHTSGELMPMPGEKKNIAATTRGMVRFVNPHLVQGAHVHKGEHLFTIASESLVEDNMKLKYEAAKNELEKSRQTYQRHKGLYKSEAISEKRYLDSRAAYLADSLAFYNLDTHISADGIKVLAPASGSLHELEVSDGLYVSEGSILAILSPDKSLMLRADLPQQYFSISQEITTANFKPAYTNQLMRLEDLDGELLAVGHSVKENDHYLPVNFLVNNNGSLLEGAFVEVYLIAGKKENVLSIPAGAIREEQGGKYVYVQVSGETYSKRRVNLGSSDGERVEVQKGLEAGERIVTRGSSLIKTASMDTGEIGHGHSH